MIVIHEIVMLSCSHALILDAPMLSCAHALMRGRGMYVCSIPEMFRLGVNTLQS